VVKGMAVQNGGLQVQSPELELRDFPGDTPNRLRKARADPVARVSAAGPRDPPQFSAARRGMALGRNGLEACYLYAVCARKALAHAK
jgi:hypothetical protein